MSKNPPKTRTRSKSVRARADAPAQALVEQFAAALPSPPQAPDLNTVWGNADVLVHQWRRELGEESGGVGRRPAGGVGDGGLRIGRRLR